MWRWYPGGHYDRFLESDLWKCQEKNKRTFNSQQMYLYIWVTDILKFYEVLFCAYCKGLFCLVVLIFLCICIKHFQHEEMRKNNSKLNFTKNRRTSWFSHGRLKMSLAWLGECWKSKVIALNSWCKQLIDFVSYIKTEIV